MTAAEGATAPADLIAGDRVPLDLDAGPGAVVSHNPARPAEVLWSARPNPDHAGRALAAARDAFPAWSAWPAERRFAALTAFADRADAHKDEIARLLARETGKPLWDAAAEAGLLAAKARFTLDQNQPHNTALRRVAGYEIAQGESRVARADFRPHGVAVVLGPFNFPVHLPNGQIIPALAMGNTVVFKPSDKAPATAQLYAGLLHAALEGANAPPGVFNLVHGAADTASALVTHDEPDAILFTGSWPVGRKILDVNLDRPGRLVALELGGNNPAVVMPDADLRQAAIEVARGAFVSAGQRCTCTRRLIVHEAVADRLLAAVRTIAASLTIGDPLSHTDETPVFMGPVITAAARDAALSFQARLLAAGAEPILQADKLDLHDGGGHFLSPGIARVGRFVRTPADAEPGPSDGFDAGCDEEVFGPLLRVAAVGSLDEAIEQANATRFGLAASIFTADAGAADRFRREARAGCVNVNTATAGASGALPFGGLGLSGNHRPAGAFALDLCAHPVASMIERGGTATLAPGLRAPDTV